MFCSTIIPTIGRQSLERSVRSVLEQNFSAADFEIIVVNDSGIPLDPADWQQSKRVQILNTYKHDKSVARNTGASIAKGDYLHFLDDDDWMLPNAFSSFWKVATKSEAAVLLYGSSHLMDRDGNTLYQLQHNWIGDRNWIIPLLTGEWMPIGAYIIRTDTFYDTGGFNPIMPTFEERDLCRRVALRGNFASTPDIVSIQYIGEENSTTDFSRGNLDNYLSREITLNQPHVFKKIVVAADDKSAFGRILRIYGASTGWNISNKKFFTATSRAFHGLASLVFAGPKLFSKFFWDGFTNPYTNKSFVYPREEKYIPVGKLISRN